MRVAAILTLLLLAGVADAQFATGFEPPDYTGTWSGLPLTFGFGGGGVQGWYNPVDGSMDYEIYTYCANELGFPRNPTGGCQFIGGVSYVDELQVAHLARAQHEFAFAEATYTIAYDICVAYLGELPSSQYAGSFSTQESGAARGYIALAEWTDENIADSWKASYIVYDAAGVQIPGNQVAGPEFEGLLTNRWYRQSTTVDFVTNMVLKVSLTDVVTGDTAVALPVGWYLRGGENPQNPLPTGFRCFTGGGLGDNAAGWDNLSIIIPEPGLVSLLGLGIFGALALRRRK